MIYVFDLDGTLCLTESGDYENAKPLYERIAKVNMLFYHDHQIIIDTARATSLVNTSDIEMVKALTVQQLFDWGVQYHKLRIGLKPFAHIYVDDRAIHSNIFFKDLK